MFLWLSIRNLRTLACNSASIYGLLVESLPRTSAFFCHNFSVIFLPLCTIHSTKQNFCSVPLNFMKNSTWWKVQAGNSDDSVTTLSHAGNGGLCFVPRTQFLLLSAFFSFNKQMPKVILFFWKIFSFMLDEWCPWFMKYLLTDIDRSHFIKYFNFKQTMLDFKNLAISIENSECLIYQCFSTLSTGVSWSLFF